jgi:proteasome assembly chaperone (PAC2) family protein
MDSYPQLNLWERPTAKRLHMIMGWRQWADAGSISSALPAYLVQLTEARKIGEILPDDFYLFQLPGTHHFLRPIIHMDDGLAQAVEMRENEIFYAGDDEQGLIIFVGDEPHLNVERYMAVLYYLAQTLGVSRTVTLGGVYGSTPYEKERYISCSYSVPRLRPELDEYAMHYSNYEGGVTIGSLMVAKAAERNLEWLSLHALVPAYDFGYEPMAQGLRIEHDFRAWYDIMRRLNRLFQLNLNLGELEEQSLALRQSLDEQIATLAAESADFDIHAHMAQIAEEFNELTFDPLDDVWTEGLADLFGDE